MCISTKIKRFNFLYAALAKNGLSLSGGKHIVDELLPVNAYKIIGQIDIDSFPVDGYDVLEQIDWLKDYLNSGRQERIEKFKSEQAEAHAWNNSTGNIQSIVAA